MLIYPGTILRKSNEIYFHIISILVNARVTKKNRYEDLYDVDDAKERALSRAERLSLHVHM